MKIKTGKKVQKGGDGRGKDPTEKSDGRVNNRRRERARTEIYQGKHPPWRISIYRKSTETGCIPMMVDTSVGGLMGGICDNIM